MKLILIDGYGFVFRAFHSLPPLKRAPDNMPIGAVLGFTNMLYRFVLQNSSNMIAVVLDSGEKNFRHKIYPQYKANRPEVSNELIVQFPIIREVIEAFNIKALEKAGFEADDLIASYTKAAVKRGHEVLIVSSDKDLMQLMSDKVKFYDAMKDREITEADVIKKFGVKPDKVKDVLSLTGDSSDNIPGVKGIGAVTAASLINEYDNLEDLYKNIDNIPQAKRKQMLIDDKENAFLSYKLITLDEDAPLEYDFQDLEEHELDSSKLADFLKLQGFKSLLNKLNSSEASAINKNSTNNLKYVENIVFKNLKKCNELISLFDAIEYHGKVFIYYENLQLFLTYGEFNYSLSFEDSNKQENLFNFNHDETNENTLENALKILKPILENRAIKVITINGKEFYKYLKKLEINVNALEDIGVIAYATETGLGNNSFDNLIERFTSNLKDKNSYALKILYEELSKKLLGIKNIFLYESIDKKLIKVLGDIESKGVKIDVNHLNYLSEEFKEKIKILERKIFQITKNEFNIASPKQLGEILFDQLKLPYGKKTKAGSYVTSIDILENLKTNGFEIASLVIDWRQYSKLISTYTDALPRSINPQTGRVHTTFMMTYTATGRLSSNEPNLQNIPIRSDEGYKIRKAFVAKPGHKIISVDYSQIELRLLAHFADIKPLKEAFKNGYDVHAITASQIFNVSLEKVDSHLRRQAKTINFGIIYGISAFGLAKRLDIPRETARKFIENYFIQYPGIKEYMDKMIEFVRENGFIKTLSGRRCFVPGINNRNQSIRGNSERAAINFPLQGTTSDIIKKAMVDFNDEISGYMILQVHDELLFEVPEEHVQRIIPLIKNIMENVVHLSVPITVDIKYGNNWTESD